MSGMWGANVARLRDMGRAFGDAAQTLANARAVLDATVEQCAWQGSDAAGFAGDWTRRHRAALDKAVTALEQEALRISANAYNQDAASAVEDGAGAQVPSGLGPSGPLPGKPSPIAEYESALREAGLLPRRDTEPLYWEWLENAARQGVDPATIVEVAEEFDIGPDDFEVLAGMTAFTDPDGKTFFLLPDDVSADDARQATLMTYILNAGTDYGDTADDNDFTESPYSAEEVRRIVDRQDGNDWSYDMDLGFVHGNGGRMVTTPNGMLMGLGGNWLQDLYSQKGGTTYGDIFMLNIDDVDDPAATLGDAVRSGMSYHQDDGGAPYAGSLDMDRLLHHEERHSQQWAREGYTGFLGSYLWEQLWGGNETEEDAGLADGGYT